MIPHRTPFFLPWIYPSVLLWRVDTLAKELFLTFDDGPVPGPTEFVLDQLDKYNARATFFCIGDNVRKHPDVFRRILAAGHAVGNHTYNHLNGWKTNDDSYLENVRMCDTQMAESGNSLVAGTLFRPPYGRIRHSQIRKLRAYRIVMWDVLSADYDHNQSPASCLKNTIAATRPGSVIVFHDSVKAEKNMMYALPGYLEYFSARGFQFKILQ